MSTDRQLRRNLGFLKAGDKVRATFYTKDKQRTYVIVGELYKAMWSSSGLFIADEVNVCYNDYDGVLIINRLLKKIRKVQ